MAMFGFENIIYELVHFSESLLSVFVKVEFKGVSVRWEYCENVAEIDDILS